MSASKKTPRRIILTAGLPYANGDVHIGHILEHVLCDIWTRFQKMRGHEALFLCGDDTHGTPIMIYARNAGISPEELIAKAYTAHLADFKAFEIEHDAYGSTNTDNHRQLCYFFYEALKKKGHLVSKKIEQYYCNHDHMFLPDRYIKGTCPKCHSEDQYGDNCEKCGASYSPSDLKKVYCSLCHNTPVLKPSEHIFVKLADFQEFLKKWLPAHTNQATANKLSEWLNDGLQDWDVSRDAPYFGIEIPDVPGKFFYVWLDAPIGYVTATQDWAHARGRDWREFWSLDQSLSKAKSGLPDPEIYHCIGKDITAFHCLFWPALLHAADLRTPNAVFVHGFLTMNGEKMSKSKGNSLSPRDYLQAYDPMYLRYYFASKLTASITDFDITVDDFANRINAELIGKITNIASRCAQLLNKKLDSKLGALPAEASTLIFAAQEAVAEIAEHYEQREFNRAIIAIREIADQANKYIDNHQPWNLIKTDPEKTRAVLTTALNLFRIICIYLKPVLPTYVKKVEALFNDAPYDWDAIQTTKQNTTIGTFEHLAQRIDEKILQQLTAADRDNKVATQKVSGPQTATPVKTERVKEQKTMDKAADIKEGTAAISINDFAKIELRVGRIDKAEAIPEAQKLLKLQVHLGSEQRTIFSGIKAAYAPEQLINKLVVVVCNLPPRTMKFGVSEGMILASGEGSQIKLVTVDPDAKPGDKIS